MVVCKVNPHKEYPNQTRITVTGCQICYPGDVGTPTRNARFVCFDLKLLPTNPDEAIQICAHEALGYPTRIHQGI